MAASLIFMRLCDDELATQTRMLWFEHYDKL